MLGKGGQLVSSAIKSARVDAVAAKMVADALRTTPPAVPAYQCPRSLPNITSYTLRAQLRFPNSIRPLPS